LTQSMDSMDNLNIDNDSLAEFDQQPITAMIETDRFCEKCGYNLRTQPTRREPRTEILLCRCPECGRFQPARDGATAGRVWLQRLGTLALLSWIIFLLALCFGLGMAQLGLTVGTLEELSYVDWNAGPVTITTQPVALGNIQITRNGVTTVYPTSGQRSAYRRIVRKPQEYDNWFRALMHTLSFLTGFLLLLLLTVALHHWRKWAYLIPATLIPVLVAAGMYYAWKIEYPYLIDWALRKITSLGAVNLAGGLTGIVFGRPFARLTCSLLLPPRIRQVMAFLWLTDGKHPPKPRTRD